MDQLPEKDIGSEPGITIYKSKISMAFTLISFMVGELIYGRAEVVSPVPLDLYKNLDRDLFPDLKEKVFKILGSSRYVHLNLQETLGMYMLIDLVCRCMVENSNDRLKELALDNLKIKEEEYEKIRMSYLHYAQILIEKMNSKFENNREFQKALLPLREWKK